MIDLEHVHGDVGRYGDGDGDADGDGGHLIDVSPYKSSQNELVCRMIAVAQRRRFISHRIDGDLKRN